MSNESQERVEELAMRAFTAQVGKTDCISGSRIQPFIAGFVAGRCGHPLRACPHKRPQGGYQRAWESGWRSGNPREQ